MPNITKNISQYKEHHDKLTSLQDNNFIPPTLNPDDILNIVDDLTTKDLIYVEDGKNIQHG